MTLTMFPLKALQQFLRNPLMIRMALGLAIFICLFLVGSVLIRKMRQQITVEMSPAGLPQEGSSAFGFAAYNGVIQQLREKEKGLQRLLEAEQQCSTSAGIIHEAVLANLSSGGRSPGQSRCKIAFGIRIAADVQSSRSVPHGHTGALARWR